MSISSTEPFSISLLLHTTYFIPSRRRRNSLSLSLSAAARRRSRRPITLAVAALPSSSRNDQKKPNSVLQTSHTKTTFLSSSLSALAALSLLFPSPSFPATLYTNPSTTTTQTELHNASEMAVVQATLSEAWNVVHRSFFDRTYNNQDWDAALQKALEEMSNINSKDEAYMKIKSMLSKLGDPYTYIVDSKEYESSDINKDGAEEGLGLQVFLNQNSCGCLVVRSSIEGGPAARAGIVCGDELLQINGEAISNMKDQEIFNLLQGQAGTPITLKFRHHESGGDSDTKLSEVTLVREKVFLSPVSAAIIPHLLQDGHSSETGYIHISSFSQIIQKCE